jgi:hypothetical protein
MMRNNPNLLPHENLVKDFNSVIAAGSNAEVSHPKGKTAKQVCEHFFKIAWENASKEEKRYLPLIRKRIENGNLSEIIKEKVQRRAQKTDLKEAILNVYLGLVKSLMKNQPYF